MTSMTRRIILGSPFLMALIGPASDSDPERRSVAIQRFLAELLGGLFARPEEERNPTESPEKDNQVSPGGIILP